jgi:hypothetical protein
MKRSVFTWGIAGLDFTDPGRPDYDVHDWSTRN